MGPWKWLSLVLLLYCLVICVLYIERAGGSNGMGDNGISASLGGCPIDVQLVEGGEGLTIRMRIDPQCAIGLSRPTLSLVSATGTVLQDRPFRGGATSLTARLGAPAVSPDSGTRVEISAVDTSGTRIILPLRGEGPLIRL
ncbi:MAG: hypothetical protein ACFB6R_16250 [Alphaproteobacteria bacterium]